MHAQLPVHVFQQPLVWENPEANRAHFETLFQQTELKGGIALLPEMFSTGFSMHPQRLAEPHEGPTLQWMQHQAKQHHCIVAGSLMTEVQSKYYNRFYWVQPNETFFYYNKRHLFGMAGEQESYTPGNKRVIVQVNGWRIALLVCYDLRFPVWARQQADAEYDVLVVCANWPERRADAWNTLLKARAIENQAYVIGINRCGIDGNGLHYRGDSQIIDPAGTIMAHAGHEACILHESLQANHLQEIRQTLPFLRDKDDFMIA